MKITKKIDTLLKRRTRLAEQLATVVSELDDELAKNGVNLSDCEICDAVNTGCMIYCEPLVAENVVRRYLERK